MEAIIIAIILNVSSPAVTPSPAPATVVAPAETAYNWEERRQMFQTCYKDVICYGRVA